MAVVLDSDAVIGFLDRGDALHSPAREAVRRLLGQGEALVVSVITYAEVLTGARLGHHDEDEVREFFGDLFSQIVPVDIEIAERSAELWAEHRTLRMPDALIAATADRRRDVVALVCADRTIARIGGLRCPVEMLD